MSRRDRIFRTGIQNAIFVVGLVCCAISQFHLPSLLDEDANHDINSDARERRLQEEIIDIPAPKPTPPPAPVISVPLHSEHGTHHAYLYVGSPPQRRTLIVDTGSRLVAFPCASCTNCGKHASTSYYDPAISTTDIVNTCSECQFDGMSKCNNDTCQFVQRYTEGSRIQAYEITDIMWLGTDDVLESMADPTYINAAVPFVFGCQTSEEGLFRNQYADGIMGVAMHQTTLVAAMYEAGAIPRHAFSLCLNYEGGTFSLGGTDLGIEASPKLAATENGTLAPAASRGPHHLEPMQYAAMSKTHGWYAVGVASVHVGDILVTTTETFLSAFNDVKGTIIDSGTTDSYLPKVIAQPFMKAWENITGSVYSNKFEGFTYSTFLKLPNITITVDGVDGKILWSATPSNYMEEFVLKRRKQGEKATHQVRRIDITKPWNGRRTFINRIYLDELKGCVLGGNFMADHDILFDITNKRIGIARAECTYQGSKYVVV